MSGLTPELADIVRTLAGPDLAATLAARLGAEFVVPNTVSQQESSSADTNGTPPRVLADLVVSDDLTDDELRCLLDFDDPHVDAWLFADRRLDDAERRRMLSGVRRDGRPGPVGAPLLDLLWNADMRRFEPRLPLAITSGDPDVAAVIVNRFELRTEAGRLRLVTGVWQRRGAAEARRVLHAASFPPATADVIEKALASPDGLDDLRARLATEEDPQQLCVSLRALTEDHESHVRQLVAEGTALPWEALLRTHAADPLRYALHVALAGQPDCPRQLLLDLVAAGLPTYEAKSAWLDEALAAGRLTPTDLLTHARPTARSLALLLADTHRDLRARWPTSLPLPAVRDLFHARLGTDTDAWAVAVRLLPEFRGSIPELLTTATAATHREAV